MDMSEKYFPRTPGDFERPGTSHSQSVRGESFGGNFSVDYAGFYSTVLSHPPQSAPYPPTDFLQPQPHPTTPHGRRSRAHTPAPPPPPPPHHHHVSQLQQEADAHQNYAQVLNRHQFEDSRGGSLYAKVLRGKGQQGPLLGDLGDILPMTEVVTEQPFRGAPYGRGSVRGAHPTLPQGMAGMGGMNMNMNQASGGGSSGNSATIPPLPGFEILDRSPSFKVQTTDRSEGYWNCRPGYKVVAGGAGGGGGGEMTLRGTTDLLFCPFDSKQKNIYVKDADGDCVFLLKFTPSTCECDSEEKRCFGVFSPVFESPFGAVMFEAGQLKYSLKILNSLEAETFIVTYVSNSDLTIKGADGTVVAFINILRERFSRPKYSLTFVEDLSSANKALFLACIFTLDIVTCEAACTKCICCSPFVLMCVSILGFALVSSFAGGGGGGLKPPH